MQMEVTLILIMLEGVIHIAEHDKKNQILQLSPICKKTEQYLLLESLLGGTVSELPRFSHQFTVWRI